MEWIDINVKKPPTEVELLINVVYKDDNTNVEVAFGGIDNKGEWIIVYGLREVKLSKLGDFTISHWMKIEKINI